MMQNAKLKKAKRSLTGIDLFLSCLKTVQV